jgi:hypothetical protein
LRAIHFAGGFASRDQDLHDCILEEYRACPVEPLTASTLDRLRRGVGEISVQLIFIAKRLKQ